jgi:adenylate cyclase
MGKVVREVSEDMVALSRFEITGVRRPTSTLAEIRAIQDGVEALKVVLSSFAKYVPAEVVGGVVRQKLQARVHLEPAEVTVAFTSIDDFHDVIETVPSATLMSLLTPYYEISAEAIERSGGLVDKYMDDAVMAFWNAPMPVDEHPAAACQAALRAVARLEKSSEQWRSRGLPPLRVRWGLHCGDVRVGNLGATDRLSYTVLGDTVNVSSRVASLARRYGAQVLVSESVMEAVGDAFLLRPVDRVKVKGRSRSLVIYELMAERELATPQQQELAARTSEAFALYQQRSFREARVMLDGLLERHRHDGPAKMLREACFAFEANPPPSDWAGERVMRSKS